MIKCKTLSFVLKRLYFPLRVLLVVRNIFFRAKKKAPLEGIRRVSVYSFSLLKRNQEKGMALIMVLSTVVFIILLIQETVFETQIEYRSAISEMNSLRAYHAAKAGMEVNILRVKTYIKITKSHTQSINQFRSYVDLIWQFPFQWPPFAPEGLDNIQTDELNKIKKNSFMQNQFVTSIKPETSRIDINDLASPIPSLRKWTFNMLYSLIFILRVKDKELEEEVSDQNIVDILNNIKDWVDRDTQQGELGVSEGDLYKQEGLPPNRSFIGPGELRQVAGMSDMLYTALTPFITVYGEKGLNVNTASLELLQALHEEFPEELAQEIVELTSNPVSPFVFTKKTFMAFLAERGFDNLKQYLFPQPSPPPDQEPIPPPDQEPIPISYFYFDAPHNFRLQSTGFAGENRKTLTATYFDTASNARRFNELMKQEQKREGERIKKELNRNRIRAGSLPQSTPPPPSNQNNQPFIIYWKESS